MPPDREKVPDKGSFVSLHPRAETTWISATANHSGCGAWERSRWCSGLSCYRSEVQPILVDTRSLAKVSSKVGSPVLRGCEKCGEGRVLSMGMLWAHLLLQHLLQPQHMFVINVDTTHFFVTVHSWSTRLSHPLLQQRRPTPSWTPCPSPTFTFSPLSLTYLSIQLG